mmetsp:Transcript_21114/g.25956  ORF Transcript_21114/g.25956 Transcript_21114/m.25956 type:complete len:191 (-) Transcript_21114:199-771(-)
MSSRSIYSSLDKSEIEKDRRIMNEKLRRHISSKHLNCDDSFQEDVTEIDESGVCERNIQSKQSEEQYDNDINEGYESMQMSLYGNDVDGVFDQELQRTGLSSSSRNLMNSQYGDVNNGRSGSYNTNGRMQAGDDISSNTTGIIPRVSVNVPRSQSLDKQISGAFYIILSLGILVSYFFFLESCKLINYGT